MFPPPLFTALVYVSVSVVPPGSGLPLTDTEDNAGATVSSVSDSALEALLTFVFLLIILGSIHGRAPTGFAPIAIGLGLTLIHLVSIPITNTSVNPARSTGVAFFAEGGWALTQLWLFWVAPVVGAVLAGLFWKALWERD